jgi:hypothetical protein
MRYVKALGIATSAVIALIVFGVGNASATKLYNGATALSVGTTIETSLKTGTSASLTTTEGTVLNTCTGSWGSSSISNAGGAGFSVTGTLSSGGWSGCNNTVSTTSGGELEVSYTSGRNGSLTAKNFQVTVQTPFGSCVFTAGASTNLGTLTGSTTGNATADVNAAVTRQSGLCPSSAKWVATYSVTSPWSLHVTAS